MTDSLYDQIELSLEVSNWDVGMEDVFAYVATYVCAKDIHVYDGINIYELEISTSAFGYPQIGGCVFRQLSFDDHKLALKCLGRSRNLRTIAIYDIVLLSIADSHLIFRGELDLDSINSHSSSLLLS